MSCKKKKKNLWVVSSLSICTPRVTVGIQFVQLKLTMKCYCLNKTLVLIDGLCLQCLGSGLSWGQELGIKDYFGVWMKEKQGQVFYQVHWQAAESRNLLSLCHIPYQTLVLWVTRWIIRVMCVQGGRDVISKLSVWNLPGSLVSKLKNTYFRISPKLSLWA